MTGWRRRCSPRRKRGGFCPPRKAALVAEVAALKEGGVSSNTIIEDFGSGLFAWESRMIGVQSPESRVQ